MLKIDAIELPIVLKNGRGELLAEIINPDGKEDKFVAYVNNHKINNYGFDFDSVTECIEATFAYLYQQMQEYRKQAEEYQEVKVVLKKALK